MSKLHVLPVQLANMIAAGEVVQRPASVVKELMENAVDAGAGDVKVLVVDAGRTLIQVIDNGCGMSPSDALLCFERHATSKISSPEDLSAIESYGFRGEALASIAAVAEVTLRTRRSGDETATQVVTQSHGELKSSSVAAPVGSSFAVRNLFYNTPARRKFLKSDNVELRHIIEEFTRVALTRPDVAFSLNSGGKDLFVLRPAKSLKFRILELMGSNVAEDVVDINLQTDTVDVSGFLARPQSARKTVANQYFFVNGRYFSSPYLRKAVMKAYEAYIPEGAMPSWFIWLSVSPGAVDVNISPTKTDVKFEEESVVYQILYASVKETLGRNAFGDGIDFDAASALQMPVIGKNFEAIHGDVQAPDPQTDEAYDPFAVCSPDFSAGGAASGSFQGGFAGAGGSVGGGFDILSGSAGFAGGGFAGGPASSGFARGGAAGGYAGAGYPGGFAPNQDFSKLFPEGQEIKNPQPSSNFLIVKGKYIIGAAASGLMAINIRRAAQRVIYEKALQALSKNKHVSQKALFPVAVQVGPQARLLFEENADILNSLGFDINSFGNDTVVVNAVPEGLSCESGKVQQMVGDMVLILSDTPSRGLQDTIFASYAERFATLESLNFTVNTSAEAEALVGALFACENSELTPNGKRILGIISAEDIEKYL